MVHRWEEELHRPACERGSSAEWRGRGDGSELFVRARFELAFG
jgi:hypothetical protein